MTILDVSSIRVTISGKPVIDGLSLSVAEGEIVCLIGAPGCGKSTLLNAIFGRVRVVSGEVRYAGERITNRASIENIRGGIALVAQGGKVFRGLPVEENLYLSGYAFDVRYTAGRIEAVYSLFPRLKERRNQLAGSLSGGERQMLALGMGLIPEPRLLLLDEPSTGLSPLLTERMLEEIKSFKMRLGCTVLVIEQNVKNAIAISDRVVILRRGRIDFEYVLTEGGDIGPLLDAYSGVIVSEKSTEPMIGVTS